MVFFIFVRDADNERDASQCSFVCVKNHYSQLLLIIVEQFALTNEL